MLRSSTPGVVQISDPKVAVAGLSITSRRRAFTLLELLVVIAIITILAALLFTGLTRARIAADSTACRSNLRQIAVGLNLYTQQERVFPLASSRPSYWWPADLESFVGAHWPSDNYASNTVAGAYIPTAYLGPRNSVWACPGYNRIHGLFGQPRPVSEFIPSGSYAYNDTGWLEAWAYQRPPILYSQGLGGILVSPSTALPRIYQATPESRILCPSDMIAFADCLFAPAGPNWPSAVPTPGLILFGMALNQDPRVYNEFVRGLTSKNPGFTLVPQRHGGKWNTTFCDGHVENLRGRDLFDFSNPAVARRWNSDNQPHNEGWQPPPPAF